MIGVMIILIGAAIAVLQQGVKTDQASNIAAASKSPDNLATVNAPASLRHLKKESSDDDEGCDAELDTCQIKLEMCQDSMGATPESDSTAAPAQTLVGTSYTNESFACQDSDDNVGGEHLHNLNYQCDSLLPPTAWQKKSDDDDVDYDLIIVGGGIGGAYMAKRLKEEFDKKGQPVPKIALFERTEMMGGRLMSGFGAGALGLAVPPREELLESTPQPEYGGMRIDPYRYPFIYNQIIQEGKRLYGDENCKRVNEEGCSPGQNCCPQMLVRMDVGQIRYATEDKEMGVLSESKIQTPSETYTVNENDDVIRTYSLEDIAAGVGTPYDKCLQLVVAADAAFPKGSPERNEPWINATQRLCSEETCGSHNISGLCELCAQFPKPAEAVISCTGYDSSLTNSADGTIFFASEVLNVACETFLYIFKYGFQRFVMSLLRAAGELGVAPHYEKTLTSLSLASGQDLEALSTAQIDALATPLQHAVVPSSDIVRAEFADGSVTTAKAVFLNMLPFDLPQVDGFTSYSRITANGWNPAILVKVVMGWNDKDDAPAAKLDMVPCVPGPCQRLILDGSGDDWLARQVWLWDEKTIMFYSNARAGVENNSAINMVEVARESGMDNLVNEMMKQLRETTGVELPDPDWARLKPWPAGTTALFNVNNLMEDFNTTSELLGGHISRPLGYNVPVYYGNSEASPKNENHGWAEGAFDMVEANLQSLAEYLGLDGEIDSVPVVGEAPNLCSN
ncbi:MAG: hypothetical protein SGILL_008387, partial [Bacillariaceae sp.]